MFSDTIPRKVLKKDWQKLKHNFVPDDLKSYTLLVEDFTPEQNQRNIEIDIERFKKIKTGIPVKDTCDLVTKNYYWLGWKDQIKWVNKFYDTDTRVVNVNYVDRYDVQKYPYALMFFGEIDWVDEKGSTSGRTGFYIWDRRGKKKFNVICTGGRKDVVWLLKNLNK